MSKDKKIDLHFPTEAPDSLGLSFIKVYNLWHRQIKQALKPYQLTHPQFVILASLGYLSQTQKTVKQVDLAINADIDVMTTSTIVRNLEKNGLLSRHASEEDTRARTIQLTEKGQERLQQTLPIVEKVDQDFFAKLGLEQATFNQLLHKLAEENI